MEQLSFLKVVADLFYVSPRRKYVTESLVVIPEVTPAVPVIGGLLKEKNM